MSQQINRFGNLCAAHIQAIHDCNHPNLSISTCDLGSAQDADRWDPKNHEHRVRVQRQVMSVIADQAKFATASSICESLLEDNSLHLKTLAQVIEIAKERARCISPPTSPAVITKSLSFDEQKGEEGRVL